MENRIHKQYKEGYLEQFDPSQSLKKDVIKLDSNNKSLDQILKELNDVIEDKGNKDTKDIKDIKDIDNKSEKNLVKTNQQVNKLSKLKHNLFVYLFDFISLEKIFD